MQMDIIYSKRAVKAISKLNNPFKQNIKMAIEKLPSGDVKNCRATKIHTDFMSGTIAYCLT